MHTHTHTHAHTHTGIISSAYYIFHERPKVLRILPASGTYTGGTKITIAGEGLFDTYRGCYAGPAAAEEESLQIGWGATPACADIKAGV